MVPPLVLEDTLVGGGGGPEGLVAGGPGGVVRLTGGGGGGAPVLLRTGGGGGGRAGMAAVGAGGGRAGMGAVGAAGGRAGVAADVGGRGKGRPTMLGGRPEGTGGFPEATGGGGGGCDRGDGGGCRDAKPAAKAATFGRGVLSVTSESSCDIERLGCGLLGVGGRVGRLPAGLMFAGGGGGGPPPFICQERGGPDEGPLATGTWGRRACDGVSTTAAKKTTNMSGYVKTSKSKRWLQFQAFLYQYT